MTEAATSPRRRVAVLISGRGSNLRALIEATRKPGFPAEIRLVVSNRPDAAGLDRAREADLRTCVIDHRDYPTRESFEAALDEALGGAGIELVCLAGFMRLLSAGFVERWRDRIINIHPSLLPAYRGLDSQARALADGVRISGCTVHFVRAGVDDGSIIAQAAVPVVADDTPARLAARILDAEHVLYPMALELVAGDGFRIENERVLFDRAPENAAQTLFSPSPNPANPKRSSR